MVEAAAHPPASERAPRPPPPPGVPCRSGARAGVRDRTRDSHGRVGPSPRVPLHGRAPGVKAPPRAGRAGGGAGMEPRPPAAGTGRPPPVGRHDQGRNPTHRHARTGGLLPARHPWAGLRRRLRPAASALAGSRTPRPSASPLPSSAETGRRPPDCQVLGPQVRGRRPASPALSAAGMVVLKVTGRQLFISHKRPRPAC